MLTIRKKLSPTWFAVAGSDPAAEFLLAPLSAAAFLDVRNELKLEEDGVFTISGQCVTDAVNASVKNWRNVLDESGQPLDFSRASLADLPPQVLHKLAVEIINRAVLWEIERKN